MIIDTEQVCVAVPLYICIWEVIGSNLDRDIVHLTEVRHGFSQSLQKISGYCRFPPNPLEFISHLPIDAIYRMYSPDTGSFVRQITKEDHSQSKILS
jgi:hypothetical protein